MHHMTVTILNLENAQMGVYVKFEKLLGKTLSCKWSFTGRVPKLILTIGLVTENRKGTSSYLNQLMCYFLK